VSDTLTPDEVARIKTIFCPVHSEILFVAGMPVREVAAWAGQHPCELTVVFGEEPTLVPNDPDDEDDW
jgi:hypothetical protein